MHNSRTQGFLRKAALTGIALASVLILSTGCTLGTGTEGSPAASNTTDANGDQSTSGNAAAGVNAQECVVGNWWFFEGPELNDFMTATTLGAFSVTTTGFAILTMNPEGTTHTTYDHWVNVVMLESAKSTIERHGEDTGTYLIDDSGILTVSDTAIGSVTTWVTETGGETITATDDPESSIFSRGEFTCSEEELQITVDGATATMYREH